MFDVHALLKLRRAESIAVMPGGQSALVCAARPSKDESRFVRDLWHVSLADGAATLLTQGEHSDHSPVALADGSILFLSDRPVNKDAPKTTQVWQLPIQGEPFVRTNEAAGVGKFVAAGDRLVVSAPTYDVPDPHAHHAERTKSGPSALHYRAMPVRHWNQWLGPPLHLISFDEGERTDRTPDANVEYLDSSFALSDDGTQLAAARGRDVGRIRSDRVVRADLDSGAILEMGTESCRYSDLLFSPSGDRIAAARTMHRDDAPGRRQMVLFDRNGRESVVADHWDLFGVPAAWLNETTLLVVAGDHSRMPLFSVDLDEAPHSIREWLGPAVGAVSCRDGVVTALCSSLHEPPTLVVMDEAGVERTRSDVARAASNPLSPTSAVSPKGAVPPMNSALRESASPPGNAIPANPSFRVEELWVEGSDGVSIQGLLAMPEGPGPHPLVYWIHGGPISQFGDQWHWRWNVAPFVSAGFAVALPNARGSTGRGDGFMAGIHRDWGGQCFEDLMDFAALAIKREDIDESRVAAMGGSFGGYMCNWIGGHPDPRVSFRALVTHASLFDLRAFYGATDYPAFFGDFFGGTPWSGDIERHSPHSSIAQWTTPTLILHGEKDYRVPIGEALALFEALQAHEVESELVVYPDEGHWIDKPRNVAHWYTTVLEFLARHLG